MATMPTIVSTFLDHIETQAVRVAKDVESVSVEDLVETARLARVAGFRSEPTDELEGYRGERAPEVISLFWDIVRHVRPMFTDSGFLDREVIRRSLIEIVLGDLSPACGSFDLALGDLVPFSESAGIDMSSLESAWYSWYCDIQDETWATDAEYYRHLIEAANEVRGLALQILRVNWPEQFPLIE